MIAPAVAGGVAEAAVLAAAVVEAAAGAPVEDAAAEVLEAAAVVGLLELLLLELQAAMAATFLVVLARCPAAPCRGGHVPCGEVTRDGAGIERDRLLRMLFGGSHVSGPEDA